METSAALWYLYSKVDTAVASDEVGDIDDYLMKLLSGMATTPAPDPNSTPEVELPRPVKVNTFLKEAEKNIEGYSHQYGILSEYAHPNYAGTALLYAKHDMENRRTDFGQNMRHGENTN